MVYCRINTGLSGSVARVMRKCVLKRGASYDKDENKFPRVLISVGCVPLGGVGAEDPAGTCRCVCYVVPKTEG